MANEFWRTPDEWPNDPPGYVFLARGFHEIGRALFGDEWPREESPTKTKLTLAQLIEESRELTDDELSKDDEDEAADAHHRMWVAVKDEIVKQCVEGRLISGVRPIEGGKISNLKPEMWNAENLERRFGRCQMSTKDPFATGPTPANHWIFLQRESLDKYLIGQPHSRAATQTPNHISPYLKVMLGVTKSMGITPDNQPKKEEVVTEIRKAWVGPPLSKRIVDVMATLVREPESQLGRAKKKIAK